MAVIRKTKSKTWLAEVRKFGQYKSKTFTTKLQAQSWAVEMEQTLTPDAIVSGKTLGDAFRRYQKEVSPGKKGWRYENLRLNKFCRQDFAAYSLNDIRPVHIYQWVDQELKRIKSSSVNRDLNLISSVFEQCKRWQWCDSNPVRGIKRPRNPRHRDRRISDEEVERIIDALGFDGETVKSQRHETAIAFLLALTTGMRQGEIWSLDWGVIYLERRFLRLQDSKNGDRRDVPLSREAIRLLKLLKPRAHGRVFSYNQKSSATVFRRLVKMAGIEDLRFHDARHEAITRMARKVDMLDLARAIGHRDPRSLMIYYNPTAEEIAGRLD